MVSSPLLIFFRATNCPPCNHVMSFWNSILERIKHDELLKDVLTIVMVQGTLGVELDFTNLPKSLKKVVGGFPTFVMVKQELWDEAMKLISEGKDDSVIDVCDESEVFGKLWSHGNLINNPDNKFAFNFPFGEQQGYKGLYDWILKAFVNVKIGNTFNFDDYIKEQTFIEEKEKEKVIVNNSKEKKSEINNFYIDC